MVVGVERVNTRREVVAFMGTAVVVKSGSIRGEVKDL
jgi:hypothetical protein